MARLQVVGVNQNGIAPLAIAEGGAASLRALALSDGSNVGTAGIARELDLSSLTNTNGDLAAGTWESPLINVAPFGKLFWFVGASGGGGGSTDFYIDWMTSGGLEIAHGPEHLGPFTGAGTTFKMVGDSNGGGGYMIPAYVHIRTVVAAGAMITGVEHVLVGR